MKNTVAKMNHHHAYGPSHGTSMIRGRGTFLLTTVVILLLAAAAWIFVYPRAVESTPVGGAQVVDPAVPATSNATGNPGPGVGSATK